jgi:hypothetical protein
MREKKTPGEQEVNYCPTDVIICCRKTQPGSINPIRLSPASLYCKLKFKCKEYDYIPIIVRQFTFCVNSLQLS